MAHVLGPTPLALREKIRAFCEDGGVRHDTPWSGRRTWRSAVKTRLSLGLVVFLGLLAIEYLVIPQFVGERKNLHLLSEFNVGWLVAGTVLEAASFLCYALLICTPLPGAKPAFNRLVRVVLATTAVDHVIPGGAAGGAAVGYQLLTSDTVEDADAGFALATTSIGSAVVSVPLVVAVGSSRRSSTSPPSRVSSGCS